MFTNAQIAKDHGKVVRENLESQGVPELEAHLRGRMAEGSKLRDLNAWTRTNVGTN